MSIHHTSLYNTDDNKPETRVVKQELIPMSRLSLLK